MTRTLATIRSAPPTILWSQGHTRNPGRERPRSAPGPHRGAGGGVVHVLGSASALIGTRRQERHRAPPIARRCSERKSLES